MVCQTLRFGRHFALVLLRILSPVMLDSTSENIYSGKGEQSAVPAWPLVFTNCCLSDLFMLWMFPFFVFLCFFV